MKRIELTLRQESDEEWSFFWDEEGRSLICQDWADENGLSGATRLSVSVSEVDNGSLRVRPDPEWRECWVGNDTAPTDLTIWAFRALRDFCKEHNTDTVWVGFEVLS